MDKVLLDLDPLTHNELLAHLLPANARAEQAAFVFASGEKHGDDLVFRQVDWFPVTPAGLAYNSSVYLELTDETRARVIKRAHDLGASIVEFHSHLGEWPAAFSASDRMGFKDFVPHVWWRLKRRPYLAVVVASSGFDALAWVAGPDAPIALDSIRVGERWLRPSGLTLKEWSRADENGSI